MIASEIFYPIKCEPILKEKVWGGTKLHAQFKKNKGHAIGESWELSGVPEAISVIANGSWAGQSIQAYINANPKAVLGEKVVEQFGTQLPLLFKFIDAQQDLSVQVHPHDAVAKKRHNTFGKNEMWYILQADPGARLLIGFNKPITPETYQHHLENNTIPEILNSVAVKPGDCFYLPTGTVHAIGGGVVLAEVQQTSDITYRIYDWNRPDASGHMRTLHIKEALDVINFTQDTARLAPETITSTQRLLCKTPYFITSEHKLTTPTEFDLAARDSFTVWMCVEGTMQIICGKETIEVSKGETIMLPAALETIKVHTEGVTLLDVCVP